MNTYSINPHRSILGGVDFTESINAVSEVVRPKPLTLDMQNMVDRLGVKKEFKPCVYFIGTRQAVIHPTILSALRRDFVKGAETRAMSAILTGT